MCCVTVSCTPAPLPLFKSPSWPLPTEAGPNLFMLQPTAPPCAVNPLLTLWHYCDTVPDLLPAPQSSNDKLRGLSMGFRPATPPPPARKSQSDCTLCSRNASVYVLANTKTAAYSLHPLFWKLAVIVWQDCPDASASMATCSRWECKHPDV